jgi:phasin family protein
MSKDTDAKSASPAWPFDFSKMLNAYKVPGVDFSALLEREKKNIAAVAEANRIAFEGWQSLVKRQSEILQQTMRETMDAARKQDSAKQRLDMAKEGFEKALSNMRELAEMAAKSNKEAMATLQKRMTESMDEMIKRK